MSDNGIFRAEQRVKEMNRMAQQYVRQGNNYMNSTNRHQPPPRFEPVPKPSPVPEHKPVPHRSRSLPVCSSALTTKSC